MPEITQVLQGLLDQMTGSASPLPGGQAFTTNVQPRPTEIDAIEKIQGDLGLTWLTKDVRFGNDGLEASLDPAALDTSIIGGLPLPGIGVPGVGGLIGQLKGTVPLLAQGKFKVTLAVTWTVLDERENPLPAEQYSAPGGLVGPSITVAFAPQVVELTNSVVPPAPTVRKLKAHVKLTVAGVPPVERDLPAIPVPVLPLPVPKILACFRHTNFQASSSDESGFVFLLVPSDSPIHSLSQLNSTLSTLQTAVGNLLGFASFASFLLGLNDLVNAVGAQPYFAIAAANEIDNLNDITAIQNGWFENDIELEDEISSLIFIGPSGKVVDIFCETDFDDENGRGKLTIPSTFAVVVRSLHADVPTTQPSGMWETLVTPDHTFTDPDGFGDWTSSLKFL